MNKSYGNVFTLERKQNMTKKPLINAPRHVSPKDILKVYGQFIMKKLDIDCRVKYRVYNISGEIGGFVDYKKGVYQIHIEISDPRWLNILCHELVHVKQFEKKELSAIQKDCGVYCEWKGQVYELAKTPYKERLWEIQAIELADVLEKELFS